MTQPDPTSRSSRSERRFQAALKAMNDVHGRPMNLGDRASHIIAALDAHDAANVQKLTSAQNSLLADIIVNRTNPYCCANDVFNYCRSIIHGDVPERPERASQRSGEVSENTNVGELPTVAITPQPTEDAMTQEQEPPLMRGITFYSNPGGEPYYEHWDNRHWIGDELMSDDELESVLKHRRWRKRERQKQAERAQVVVTDEMVQAFNDAIIKSCARTSRELHIAGIQAALAAAAQGGR